MPKTYTVKQVADALGFSTNTVYKYLDEGKIKATRLGGSGRFKIPETEVRRLLGAPQSTTEATQQTQTSSFTDTSDILAQTNPSLSPLPQDVSKESLAKPQLFDWFLSLSAIFLGIVNISSPVNNPVLAGTEYFLNLNLGIAFWLIISGAGLFLADVFSRRHRLLISSLGKISLFLAFASLSVLYLTTTDFINSGFLGIYALASATSLFVKPGSSRIMIIVYSLAIAQIGFLSYSPNHSHTILPMTIKSIMDSDWFKPLSTVVTILYGILLIVANKTNRNFFAILSWSLSVVFIVTTMACIANQQWLKTTSALFVSCFTFLLPFSKQLETFGNYTRKRLLASFCWIVITILIGLIAVKLNQHTTTTLVKSTSQTKLNSAGNYASNFLRDASEVLKRTTIDTKFSSPSASQKSLDDRTRDIYFSSTAFRRVIIASTSGEIISAYPPLPETKNISNSSFFTEIMTRAVPLIDESTGGLNGLSQNSISLGIPVSDSTGNITAVVMGIIDSSTLRDQLSLLVQSESSQVVITNSNRQLLIGIGSIEADQLFSTSDLVYDSSGRLNLKSFANISELDWQIALLQPYSIIFRQSTYISSLIFFICAVLGIGSLLLVNRSRQLNI